MPEPAVNPFTPEFGAAPPLLVGRDHIRGRLRQSLQDGPRSTHFTSLILGPRGAGKTALVRAVMRSAESEGWTVLWTSSGRGGDLENFKAAVSEPGAAESCRRWARRRSKGKAKTDGTGVLLGVDELHAADAADILQICDAVQRIANHDGRPLAFLGAGLGEIQHGLLAGEQIAFLQRCPREHVGLLPPEAVVPGLRAPIQAAGGTITKDALRLILDHSPMLPFQMQLIGRKMWGISGAPAGVIDGFAAEAAVRHAEHDMASHVHTPAWRDLSEREQKLLAALSASGGECDVRGVEAKTCVPGGRRAFNTACLRLEHRGYITRAGHPILRSTGLMPAAMVADFADREGINDPTRTTGRSTAGRPAVKDRCGKEMIRVPGRCILPEGHSGGCRSKR